jgi:hypothetical protein
MKISDAKKGVVCSMVMAVNAPDEEHSSDCQKKAIQQIEYLASHYKDKLMKECTKKAEKFFDKPEGFQKYFDEFVASCKANAVPYLE